MTCVSGITPSAPCLHAHVNVCSWTQQGIWYPQRLSSHKVLTPKEEPSSAELPNRCPSQLRNIPQNKSLMTFLLRENKSFYQISNLMFEWFWCTSQRHMLLKWTSVCEHEFCPVGWKRSFWKELFSGFVEIVNALQAVSGITKNRPWTYTCYVEIGYLLVKSAHFWNRILWII